MSEVRPRKRFQWTIGGMLLIVAVVAVGVAWLRPGVLRVVDLKVGTGPTVKPGDTVTVHYSGRLPNGTVFDDSKKRGQPFDFKVGSGMVIKGWDAGLVGMQVGGVRRLTIPPDQAYGNARTGMIPPGSTLVFDVDLLGVR